MRAQRGQRARVPKRGRAIEGGGGQQQNSGNGWQAPMITRVAC